MPDICFSKVFRRFYVAAGGNRSRAPWLRGDLKLAGFDLFIVIFADLTTASYSAMNLLLTGAPWLSRSTLAFQAGSMGSIPIPVPRFLERARASSESWVVCDTRYPSMEASLS